MEPSKSTGQLLHSPPDRPDVNLAKFHVKVSSRLARGVDYRTKVLNRLLVACLAEGSREASGDAAYLGLYGGL